MPDQASLAPDGFSERLRQLEPVLRSYVARRAALSPDAQADVVQDVFLRLLRYRQIEDIDQLRWLMLRVSSSVLVDLHRRTRSRGSELPLDEDRHARDTDGDPARAAEAAATWRVVSGVIAGLSPQCRRVFVLHRFQGMSYREIADRFDVSVRTVENQIAHALSRCRAAFKEDP